MPAAEKIALRARATRELTGTLTGYAAGHPDGDEPARSFAARRTLGLL